MLLQNNAQQIIDFVDLKGGELDLIMFVDLAVQRANEDLSGCYSIVDRNLGDVFWTALDVGHNKRDEMARHGGSSLTEVLKALRA